MEQSVTKAKQLEERMLIFAADIIQWAEKLAVHRSVIDQIIRSVTSIGANYAEAFNASSKTDFRNKIYIAKKEAAETKYWLKLLCKLRPESANDDLTQECQHILMILQKTVNTINDQRKRKDQ
jgi:four helix bundle protein